MNPPSQSSVDRTTGDKDDQLPGNSNLLTAMSTPADLPTARKIAKVKAPAKTPRLGTKKAREEADLSRRQVYAQKVFDDLNKSVFKEGLPSGTQLVWNKRLLTTAGKAKYHRYGYPTETLSADSCLRPVTETGSRRRRLSLRRRSLIVTVGLQAGTVTVG